MAQGVGWRRPKSDKAHVVRNWARAKHPKSCPFATAQEFCTEAAPERIAETRNQVSEKPGYRCNNYAAAPAMIDALWPPKPKLLLITARNWRSRGLFGV